VERAVRNPRGRNRKERNRRGRKGRNRRVRKERNRPSHRNRKNRGRVRRERKARRVNIKMSMKNWGTKTRRSKFRVLRKWKRKSFRSLERANRIGTTSTCQYLQRWSWQSRLFGTTLRQITRRISKTCFSTRESCYTTSFHFWRKRETP
jgi:hypothetical protein